LRGRRGGREGLSERDCAALGMVLGRESIEWVMAKGSGDVGVYFTWSTWKGVMRHYGERQGLSEIL
jgi:hypothetical protein